MFKKFFFCITILAILMLVVVSCSEYPTYPTNSSPPYSYSHRNVYADINFSDKERDILISALDEWNCSTNHIVNLVYMGRIDKEYSNGLNPDTDIFVKRTSESDPIVKYLDKGENGGMVVVGYFQDINDEYTPQDLHNLTARIYIVPSRVYDYGKYKSLFIHEFGHSIGLYHLKIEGTVMWPALDKASINLTKDDLINFCDLYHCDPAKLSVKMNCSE